MRWAACGDCGRTGASVEQLSQTEAERQGERLKSALLDSVTHDFRTPLTSMKAAVTSLLASGEKVVPQGHELLTIIKRRVRPAEPSRRRGCGDGAAGSRRNRAAFCANID